MSAEPSPAPVLSAPRNTSRRRALGLIGAGGGALLAGLFTRDAAQAGHDATNVFHLGVINASPGDAATTLNANAGEAAGNPADAALNLGGPLNVFAQAYVVANGPAHVLRVQNSGTGGDAGAIVASTGGTGSGYAVEAYGAENAIVGVSGDEGSGPVGAGTGVQGVSGTGVGVQATSVSGLALAVSGPSAFSTAGSAAVPSGANAVFVANAAVTNESHITVTLMGDPGPRQLLWVERFAGLGFTVNLSSAPKNKRPLTPLTYLIVEPNV